MHLLEKKCDIDSENTQSYEIIVSNEFWKKHNSRELKESPDSHVNMNMQD